MIEKTFISSFEHERSIREMDFWIDRYKMYDRDYSRELSAKKADADVVEFRKRFPIIIREDGK